MAAVMARLAYMPRGRRYGDATFCGPAGFGVALAGDAHEAAHALEDEIVAGAVALGRTGRTR